MGRKKHPEPLTPAEQRVLDEIRTGATNAEIAVRLGLSINTVKYHVANMLAKLEAEDRRELALWDGATRPRWQRRAMWAAASIGLIAVGLAAVAFFAAPREPERKIFVVEVDDQFGHILHVHEVLSGESRELRSPAGTAFAGASWSPDGTRLVAWEDSRANYYFHIWDADGKTIARAVAPIFAVRMVWAPDSSAFLVRSDAAVAHFTRDGELLAHVALPGPRVDGADDFVSGPHWSPDSARYIYARGQGLVLGDRHGGHETHSVPSGLDASAGPVLPLRWASPTTVEFIYPRGDSGAFTVDVTADHWVAEPSQSPAAPSPAAPLGADRHAEAHAFRDGLEAQRPGFAIVGRNVTADGRGEYFRLDDTKPRVGRRNSVIVVRAGGQEYEFELATKDTLGPLANLDVVLVGDWPRR